MVRWRLQAAVRRDIIRRRGSSGTSRAWRPAGRVEGAVHVDVAGSEDSAERAGGGARHVAAVEVVQLLKSLDGACLRGLARRNEEEGENAMIFLDGDAVGFKKDAFDHNHNFNIREQDSCIE
jgi:hypothetical protein